MQRLPQVATTPPATGAPLVLLFERNDAIAVPLLGQLRTAGYDVRAARIPVEVFDLIQREPIDLLLVDLGNAAANRREFWVGLDTQRRNRTIHVITFRYMSTGETGQLEDGTRLARADVDIMSANGFGPLIEAVRARLPGARPVSTLNDGPPPNLGLPPIATPISAARAPLPAPAIPPPTPLYNQQWSPLPGPASPQDIFADTPDEPPSPFDTPYSDNPFKRGHVTSPQPPTGDPFGMPGNGMNGQRATPPVPGSRGRPSGAGTNGVGFSLNNVGTTIDSFASGFGASPQVPARNGSSPNWGAQRPPERNGRARESAGAGSALDHPASGIPDSWEPPEPSGTSSSSRRRGIAYRGYDEDPLAPDDPRIEGQTSPIPAVMFEQDGDYQGGVRNDRALSTILMDSAVMAPQRLDALRSVQQTLASVGMDFSLGDLAMLFKFLTPDQLLAALLVSRGIVTAEEIASLGRIKQELLAAGKDYDLDTLLVMFNVLPAEEVRALRSELM